MSRVQHRNGLATGDEALAGALTSDDGVTRIMARGAASGWVEAFGEWVNAEFDRAKADTRDIMIAMILLQTQTLAGIAAQISRQEGDQALVEAWIGCIRAEAVNHMRKTREHVQ